jgi:hypothetical protein
MNRIWIGLALLSTSWLWGLGYYHHGSWLLWSVATLAGALLLYASPVVVPGAKGSALAAGVLLPAVVLLGWPYRAAPVLLAVGLVLCAAPIPRRWPRRLGSGIVLAGAIVLVQSLALAFYAGVTARSHELPRPLARLLAAIAQFLGAEAALDRTTLAVRTVRAVHRLGATWELLLDPVTWSFLVGGIVLLYLTRRRDPWPDRQVPRWTHAAALLILLTLLWLPLRAALQLSFWLHRDFRTDYSEPLLLMNQFWSPWLHLALLAPLLFLTGHFVRWRSSGDSGPAALGTAQRRSPLPVAALAFAGVFLLTVSWSWDPAGTRQPGRVLVDEHHSQWEPTQRPYDANWYGPEAGYNYACIYDYCSHFYEMSRLEAPVDANALGQCDVLMIKTPTQRYEPEEVAAIARFVAAGGGVLLIGDHTNVFKMGTCLNDVATCFGFAFRHDCLWDIDTLGEQVYRAPVVPHPIVRNVPRLDFATGCSIDPGQSLGRPVIQTLGLRSLPAEYHVGNFMPPAEDRAESRYGAFIQLWAVRHGAGRVAAFTDSTIFSNFATFEPGKAELMLGMLEWLNHRNRAWDPRPWLAPAGAVALAVALALARGRRGAWLYVLAVGMFSWAGAALTVRTVHACSMPSPKEVRPYVQVVMDRTVCDAPLSRSGVIMGQAHGFGVFERWVLRLGYFTSRRQGEQAFEGDLLVLLYPNQRIEDEFRTRLVEYVSEGGRVLLLDSPENAESTANSLLYPFGLSLERDTPISGVLQVPQGWPATQVGAAYRVTGGEPFITVAKVPVAARVNHGKGAVAVVGFGSKFSDANMGVTGEAIPDSNLRRLFDLEFSLLQACVSGFPSPASPKQ